MYSFTSQNASWNERKLLFHQLYYSFYHSSFSFVVCACALTSYTNSHIPSIETSVGKLLDWMKDNRHTFQCIGDHIGYKTLVLFSTFVITHSEWTVFLGKTNQKKLDDQNHKILWWYKLWTFEYVHRLFLFIESIVCFFFCNKELVTHRIKNSKTCFWKNLHTNLFKKGEVFSLWIYIWHTIAWQIGTI